MERSHEPASTGPSKSRHHHPDSPKTPVSQAAVRALALQRAAGNRATARALSRWAAHPDKDKKGAFVPDVVADELMHFDPPKNK